MVEEHVKLNRTSCKPVTAVIRPSLILDRQARRNNIDSDQP